MCLFPLDLGKMHHGCVDGFPGARVSAGNAVPGMSAAHGKYSKEMLRE